MRWLWQFLCLMVTSHDGSEMISDPYDVPTGFRCPRCGAEQWLV